MVTDILKCRLPEIDGSQVRNVVMVQWHARQSHAAWPAIDRRLLGHAGLGLC